MKIVIRTLVILAAGLLVAGALFAFGQSSFASRMREAGPRTGRFEGGAPPQRDAAALPEGGFAGRHGGEHGGEHGGGHGPSLSGLVQVVESLAKIGALVALVAIVTRLFQGRKRPAPATSETTRL
jgi:hypothetical protein